MPLYSSYLLPALSQVFLPTLNVVQNRYLLAMDPFQMVIFSGKNHAYAFEFINLF